MWVNSAVFWAILNHIEFLNRTNIQNIKFLTTIKFSEKSLIYKNANCIMEQSKEVSDNVLLRRDVLELDSKKSTYTKDVTV